jgi:hypothetical protein
VRLYYKIISKNKYFSLEESELRNSKSADNIIKGKISEVINVPCMARQNHKAASPKSNYQLLKERLSKRVITSSGIRLNGADFTALPGSMMSNKINVDDLRESTPKTPHPPLKPGKISSRKIKDMYYDEMDDRLCNKQACDYDDVADKMKKETHPDIWCRSALTKSSNFTVEPPKMEKKQQLLKTGKNDPSIFSWSGVWNILTGKVTNDQLMEYIDYDEDLEGQVEKKEYKKEKDKQKKKKKK